MTIAQTSSVEGDGVVINIIAKLSLTSLTMYSSSSKIESVCSSPACSAILYRFTADRYSTHRSMTLVSLGQVITTMRLL